MKIALLFVKDGKQWILAEVKSNITSKLSPNLKYCAKQLGVKHVFKVGARWLRITLQNLNDEAKSIAGENS